MTKAFLFLILSAVSLSVFAQRADTLKYCLRDNAVAGGGYDPVSYFKRGRPVPRSAAVKYQFEGVVFRLF